MTSRSRDAGSTYWVATERVVAELEANLARVNDGLRQFEDGTVAERHPNFHPEKWIGSVRQELVQAILTTKALADRFGSGQHAD